MDEAPKWDEWENLYPVFDSKTFYRYATKIDVSVALTADQEHELEGLQEAVSFGTWREFSFKAIKPDQQDPNLSHYEIFIAGKDPQDEPEFIGQVAFDNNIYKQPISDTSGKRTSPVPQSG